MAAIRIHRLNLEVLSPHIGCCNQQTGPVDTPKNLVGSISCPVAVVGRLSSTPGFQGSISTGKTRVNGRLSVTHDLGLFNV